MDVKHITVGVTRAPGTEDLALPAYQSDHASGMDICAAVTEPVTLGPGQIELIPTGLHMAIPPGYEVQIRPRSGLALKHGIFVVNTPGTIDADYRGEVRIILGNIGKETFTIERGMRICQMVVQTVVQADWDVREELDETDRGHGGFGHTGH
jgi:dUTP diphosphatase